LHLAGAQGVRLDKEGNSKSRGLYVPLRKRKRKSSIGNRIFVRHGIVSAIKRVEFVRERMSLRVLGGRWCNIFLNVHASIEEESDYSKDSFDNDSEQVSGHFPKYNMKIVVGYFNAKF
jgi:hypothetical protein